MEVDVEVQRRAEPLDQRDRARAGRLLRKAGLADQVGMSAWVSTFVLSTIVLRLSAQRLPKGHAFRSLELVTASPALARLAHDACATAKRCLITRMAY